MNKGFVALVGAGPGAAGLLTLRGRELLDNAEAVVYDRLVSEDILKLIPEKAERINVGKESSNHLVPQEAINKILLSLGQRGKRVVRLKGGDPFVFGRGGEELELLWENNIRFEVVPGITSSIAAPSFGGIPVTHRDFCSSFHVITGHQRENEPLKIDFDTLSKLKGTLVFLMGVASLKSITEGLMMAGMSTATGAAIVERGTTDRQRKVVGTLGTICTLAREKSIKSPAVIIVGQVCTLSDKFDWFSKRPLYGKKVVVTAPGSLSQKLKELGAQAVDYHCIKTGLIENNTKLDEAVEELHNFDWLLFTSRNGVSAFFDSLLKKSLDSRYLAGVKIGAVGAGTALALKERGIIADFVPEKFSGEELGRGIAKITNTGDNVLLVRAGNADPKILQALDKAGVKYNDLPVYETKYQTNEPLKVNDGETLYTAFTSASTVEGFVRNMPNYKDLSLKGICIGESTAKKAAELGIKNFTAENASIDSLVEKIQEVCQGEYQTETT